MPKDIAILKFIDKPALDALVVKSTGNTSYTWEAYENDIQIDGLHQMIYVEGVTKLAQGIFKIVLTPKGSLAVDPEYGTNLQETLENGKVFLGSASSQSNQFNNIQTEIINALKHYNLINQDNPDSDEVIETIEEVRVVQSLDEPRQLQIRIEVTTESGKTLRVSVPQVV